MEDHTLELNQFTPLVRYKDKVFTDLQIKKTTVQYSSAMNESGINVDLYTDIYEPKQ